MRCIAVWFSDHAAPMELIAVCKDAEAWAKFQKSVKTLQEGLGYTVKITSHGIWCTKGEGMTRRYTITSTEYH